MFQPPIREEAYFAFLRENHYTDPKRLADGRCAVVYRFMFTHAIIVMRMGDLHGYDDRWCYGSYEKAKAALDAWEGQPGTEPADWHRHPATGRRVMEDGTADLYL